MTHRPDLPRPEHLEHLELLEDDAPEPFPHAWLVALVAWDHDTHAHLTPRHHPSGLVLAPNAHPAVLLAVVRALAEPSPLDVTAAELAGAAEAADLTTAQRAELPAALASFTAWACRRGVLEGEPLPVPPAPSPLRVLRAEH